MPGGLHAYIPAVKVCFFPRSMSSPSRIQTSSQKSCVIVSVVSTPASNWSSRVTSPSSLLLKIFCLTPAPPAPPVGEAATGSQVRRSGLKNSSSGLGIPLSPPGRNCLLWRRRELARTPEHLEAATVDSAHLVLAQPKVV